MFYILQMFIYAIDRYYSLKNKNVKYVLKLQNMLSSP